MKCSIRKFAFSLVVGLTSAMPLLAHAQAPAQSAAQQAMAEASSQGKFSYIVFYRNDDDLTRAMVQVVNDRAAKQPQVIAPTFVQVTNPAEAAVVEQFNMGRAPMPLTLVTAPNGAVTGVFPQRVTEQQLADTFVTPAMSHCMKAMQQGKLVFLALQTTEQVTVPPGVAQFLIDPQFKDRATVVPIQAADQAEAQLLAELQLGTAPNQPTIVFFAPPGVMVGKFGLASSKEEITYSLHKAGKCCEDPNCKHNHAAKPGGNVR
jgi:hypothetical protein